MSADDAKLILYRLDQQAKQLGRIEQHVSETNGRVKALELWRARMDGARWAISWLPTAVVTIGAGTLSGVLVYLLT